MARKIPAASILLACIAAAASAQASLDGQPFLDPPEAYGPSTQVLVLGAAAFHPQGPMTFDYSGNGYVHRTGGTSARLWAPVNLPNGAVVDHLCAQVYDTNAAGNLTVEWSLYELGSAQAAPTIVDISSATDNYSSGYHIFCVPDVPHTIRSLADFDGDGNASFVAYRIIVNFPGTDTTVRFGGAWMYYHLQVSPAPAAATFTDVPVDHPFFRYVEALSQAGITAGCNANPPEFCPDEPLTRGQMAVFLAVALGLHFPS